MSGRDMQDLVDSIADAVGAGVSVDDLTGHLVAYSAQRVDVDRARVQAILRREVSADILDWERRHGVPAATAPVVLPADADLGLLARVCVPLIHEGVRTGLLWVLLANDTDADAALAAVDRVRREIGALAAGHYEQVHPATTDLRAREQPLFARACAGDARALSELRAGWETTAGRLVQVHVLLCSDDTGAAGPATRQDRLARTQAVLQCRPLLYVVGDSHSALLTDIGRSARHLVRDASLAHRSTMAERDPGRSVVGTSEPFERLPDLPRAHRQAVAAAQVAAVEPGRGPALAWADIGLYRFLAGPDDAGPDSARPDDAGRDDADRTWNAPLLRKLRAHDADGELAATLEAWYDRPGGAAEVAERLHLHRTTVYYRLERIRDILGVDPLDGWYRLELHAALKAQRWSRRPRI